MQNHTKGFINIFIILLILGAVTVGSYYGAKKGVEFNREDKEKINSGEPKIPTPSPSKPIVSTPSPEDKPTEKPKEIPLSVISPKGGEKFEVSKEERAGIPVAFQGNVFGIPLYYFIDINGNEIPAKEISRAIDCQGECKSTFVYIGAAFLPKPNKYKIKLCDASSKKCAISADYFTVIESVK